MPFELLKAETITQVSRTSRTQEAYLSMNEKSLKLL